MKTKPKGTITENATAKGLNALEYLLLTPTDWKEEAKP